MTVKIQDFGTNLRGRQEQYWLSRLKPKYERYRPGFRFKFKLPEQIAKENVIPAFEFGRWTTQNERFDFLAAADASFADMAKVTGIKKIGLNKIGIAYGARGKGGSAAAHFEPGSFMINLTKTQGMGSYAHEYGHALDYFFGGFVDQDPASFSLSGGGSVAAKPIDKFPASTLRGMMAAVLNAIIWEKPGKYSASYEEFKKIGGPYWIERTEMFARAFEQWTHHQLAKKKVTNVFLTKSKYEANRYLKPNDFKRVLPHMNKLITAMAAKTK